MKKSLKQMRLVSNLRTAGLRAITATVLGGLIASVPMRAAESGRAPGGQNTGVEVEFRAARAQCLVQLGQTAGVPQTTHILEASEVLQNPGPRLALSASLFATERKGPVNNVALLWATADSCDSFEVYRAGLRDLNFTKIYSGHGVSYNDYGLAGGAYFYKLVAYYEGKTLTSNLAQVTTMAMPPGVDEYSNQTGAGPALGQPLKIGDTYYRFPGKREGKTVSFTVETSTDGKVWKAGPVVLDQTSHPDLGDFKFESGTFFYDKIHDRIVWWAHWERSQGYASGRAFVATAKPGERFTVHHIYNPLGVQVRDMSVFVDDDRQGWLVAASNLPARAPMPLFPFSS